MATCKGVEHDVRFPLPNGFRHGHGKRFWANGATYEGRSGRDGTNITMRLFSFYEQEAAHMPVPCPLKRTENKLATNGHLL